MGLPWWYSGTVDKNLPASAEATTGSIPGWGRFLMLHSS